MTLAMKEVGLGILPKANSDEVNKFLADKTRKELDFVLSNPLEKAIGRRDWQAGLSKDLNPKGIEVAVIIVKGGLEVKLTRKVVEEKKEAPKVSWEQFYNQLIAQKKISQKEFPTVKSFKEYVTQSKIGAGVTAGETITKGTGVESKTLAKVTPEDTKTLHTLLKEK